MNPKEVEEIFATQKDRSLQLRTERISERRKRLKKLRQWILHNKASIRTALLEDLRKSEPETDLFEIYPVTAEINKALRNLKEWSRAKAVSSEITYLGTSAAILPEPKGTCLIISPWNFPFQLTIVPLVSCLSAGNTAILKPSEATGATSRLIGEMVRKVFNPDEVHVVEGAVEETTHLLSLPFDHMFFTGSTRVGSIVMQAAAKVHASCTLELGGKSPVIVDETADIKDAARKVAWGKFINCGQICLAPDYVFVHSSHADTFNTELKKATQEMFGGRESFRDNPAYPRMVSETHTRRMDDLVEDVLKNKGNVLMGGTRDVDHKYIEPTLVDGFDDNAKVWKEEIFGPILPIRAFEDLDEVIRHINSLDKPLALYHFSKSKKHQKRIAIETSSGSLVVNDAVSQHSHPNLPFGGVGASGTGKSHGYQGFLEFSHQKAVMKQRVGYTMPQIFYPPYTGFAKWLMSVLIRWF